MKYRHLHSCYLIFLFHIFLPFCSPCDRPLYSFSVSISFNQCANHVVNVKLRVKHTIVCCFVFCFLIDRKDNPNGSAVLLFPFPSLTPIFFFLLNLKGASLIGQKKLSFLPSQHSMHIHNFGTRQPIQDQCL